MRRTGCNSGDFSAPRTDCKRRDRADISLPGLFFLPVRFFFVSPECDAPQHLAVPVDAPAPRLQEADQRKDQITGHYDLRVAPAQDQQDQGQRRKEKEIQNYDNVVRSPYGFKDPVMIVPEIRHDEKASLPPPSSAPGARGCKSASAYASRPLFFLMICQLMSCWLVYFHIFTY